jgi:hypothetical protein
MSGNTQSICWPTKPSGRKLQLKAVHVQGRKRVYDKVVRDALVSIGEAFNCPCGKRFALLLKETLANITVWPSLAVDPTVPDKHRHHRRSAEKNQGTAVRQRHYTAARPPQSVGPGVKLF